MGRSAEEARRKAAVLEVIPPAVLLAALLSAAPAAQGLGTAAQKAAEQRREVGKPVRTLSDKDLPGQATPLNPVNFEAYSDARTEIGALRCSRPALKGRLFEASRLVTRLSELAPVLAAEPSIVEILTRYGFTPEEYLRVEQAVLTAMYWSRLDLPEEFDKRIVHRANVQFVRDNARLARRWTERYIYKECGRPWFDMDRFIEHF